MTLPDLRLDDGTVGAPPAELWFTHDAATALRTDPDTVWSFAINNDLPCQVFENTASSASPEYRVYTFVERVSFVRAWMREVNR